MDRTTRLSDSTDNDSSDDSIDDYPIKKVTSAEPFENFVYHSEEEEDAVPQVSFNSYEEKAIKKPNPRSSTENLSSIKKKSSNKPEASFYQPAHNENKGRHMLEKKGHQSGERHGTNKRGIIKPDEPSHQERGQVSTDDDSSDGSIDEYPLKRTSDRNPFGNLPNVFNQEEEEVEQRVKKDKRKKWKLNPRSSSDDLLTNKKKKTESYESNKWEASSLYQPINNERQSEKRGHQSSERLGSNKNDAIKPSKRSNQQGRHGQVFTDDDSIEDSDKYSNKASSYDVSYGKLPNVSNQTEEDESEERASFSSSGQPSKRKLNVKTSSDDSTANKKKKTESSSGNKREGSSLYQPIHNDNKGRHMLEKMGYRFGEGLGINKQGIVNPVELPNQQGRRGLGSNKQIVDFSSMYDDYDPDNEFLDIKEEVIWLSCPNEEPFDIELLRSWKEEGEKSLSMDEMTDFCDPKVLKGVLKNKTIFDALAEPNQHMDMVKARTRSNPFETIARGIFLNRAAMKMANIDSRFDFMFTDPKDEYNKSMVKEGELLYFADVCAGPGGFSEYALWRKKWHAKGFGFTLKNDNDFKLQDFYAGPCETFEPYYGIKGDGDIYDPDNITSLSQLVMRATNNDGVHFMMADGGFSVEGQENSQEILSKQLYLTQFLVGLSIIRTGGHFVCKLFDVFTPFSAGLVYLMYHCFAQTCIFKPNTSRPANSERYIVCKWKRSDVDNIRQYMFELNERVNELKSSDSKSDITHCVPTMELKGDREFFNYLVESNNRLGKRQMSALAKIALFFANPEMVETKQVDLQTRCLEEWKVPLDVRKADRTTPDEATKKILNYSHPCAGVLILHETLLKPDNLHTSFRSVYDWKYVILGNPNELKFYLGLGRNKVYRFNGKRWEGQCNIELSPGTIVYGEMVQELIGEGKGQRKINVLHIFDAISLGYEDISLHHYNDRLQKCFLYAEALKKYSVNNITMRVIGAQDLEKANRIFESLTVRYNRSNKPELYILTKEDNHAYRPKGVLFFKTTKDKWTIAKSSRTGDLYYFNTSNQQSSYEKPAEAIANVKDCICGQRIWLWEEGIGVHKEPPVEGVLHKDELLKFIRDLAR